MKVYAERSSVRVRQVALDALVVAWVYVWVRVGMTVHDLVARLSAVGETIEAAGAGFSGALLSAADEIDIPLVGDQIRRPFDEVASAGRTLEEAGRIQQDSVLTLALWLGTLLALVPILIVLMRWLPRRLTWIKEASAAAAIRGTPNGAYVLALRAAVTRPLHEILRQDPDPGGALAGGQYERLATLELRTLGLQPRDAAPTAP